MGAIPWCQRRRPNEVPAAVTTQQAAVLLPDHEPEVVNYTAKEYKWRRITLRKLKNRKWYLKIEVLDYLKNRYSTDPTTQVRIRKVLEGRR